MLTSHELFGFMSPSLALDILTYIHESDKLLYRATLGAVADARKLRPVFLQRQPHAQRDATILTSLSRPALDPVASNLLRAWLLKKHRPMLGDFLDALGIAHQEGVVDDLPPTMDEAKIRTAVDALLAKHPPEVVAVYLHAFSEMNTVGWEPLKTMLESDPRLQLGGAS